jgi:Glucosyl transferase GtrII
MVEYEADPRIIGLPRERLSDWLKPASILWLIFLALNLSWLSGLNFHVDNEISAIRVDPLIWLEQGRWGAYLFEGFVLPRSFLATFPVAFYGLMGCFAYLLILSSMGVKSAQLRIYDYLLFPIFISFPSITFLFSYSANIVMQGLALLLAAASARVFARSLKAADRRGFIGDSVLVLIWGAFAISLYQTNVLLLCASLMVPVFYRFFAEDQGWKVGQALKAVFLALLLSAGAFSLYWLAEINWLNKLHLTLFYIPTLVDQSLFLKAPLSVLANNCTELVNLVAGAVSVYGTSGQLLGMLILLSLVVVLVNLFKSPGSLLTASIKAILLIGFLVSPISFGLLLKIPAPVRSIVSLPLVVWFIVWMALRCLKRPILARGMVVILAFGLINLFYVISYRASSNQLIQSHDLRVAEAIAQECARKVPGYTYKNSSKYFLSLRGKLHFENIFGPTADSDTEISIFEIEYVRPLRVIALLRLLGLADFRLMPQQEEPRLDPYFAEMPCWPAPGAVKLVGNVVLLKLGE